MNVDEVNKSHQIYFTKIQQVIAVRDWSYRSRPTFFYSFIPFSIQTKEEGLRCGIAMVMR